MKLALSSSPTAADVLFLLFHKGETLTPKTESALGRNLAKQIKTHFKAKDFFSAPVTGPVLVGILVSTLFGFLSIHTCVYTH